MITDSNQVCFVKMIGRRFQEVLFGNDKGRTISDPAFALLELNIDLFLNILQRYSEWNRSKNSNSCLVYLHLNEEDIFGIEVFTKNIFPPSHNRFLGYSCRVLSPFG